MTGAEPKEIKVKSIEFSDPPFRKLRNIKINFADRLTLIAGHNGIGKSTILGLVANTFGITQGGTRSYFRDEFTAPIERSVYLALSEAENAKNNRGSVPVVATEVNGAIVRKQCAMTQRGEWKRARVVPRTIGRKPGDPIGQDAKIPLPTLYFGMKRLASVGEADENDVLSSKLDMHPEDSKVYMDFVDSVILGSQVTDDITHQSIRGSKKKSAQPGYKLHDAHAISLGQDSLGSIATALASFNLLMRTQGDDYVGGLLVIDELDAGLHPHAIDRLAKALKSQARRLRLQIVATTHSPRLIQAVHPDGGGDANAPDAVIYLLDTTYPHLAPDQSLAAIQADLGLDPEKMSKPSKPTVCVYLEDREGMQFFEILLPAPMRRSLGAKHGVRLKAISLGVGGSNLLRLPKHDPIFRDRVLVVDADTEMPKASQLLGNAVKLPCPKGATGTARSPENMIRLFLRNLTEEKDDRYRQSVLKLKTRNPSTDRVRNTFFPDDWGSSEREASKRWWVKHWAIIKQWGVITLWAEAHPDEVAEFIAAFESAVAITAKRLQKH